jgi:hypothetical protein
LAASCRCRRPRPEVAVIRRSAVVAVYAAFALVVSFVFTVD